MADDGRVQVMVRLPKALVRRLDHWAIDNDIKSRARAFEVLLAEALEARRGGDDAAD